MIFLAREGLSYASLKRMPDAGRAIEEAGEEEMEPQRARARLPG